MAPKKGNMGNEFSETDDRLLTQAEALDDLSDVLVQEARDVASGKFVTDANGKIRPEAVPYLKATAQNLRDAADRLDSIIDGNING